MIRLDFLNWNISYQKKYHPQTNYPNTNYKKNKQFSFSTCTCAIRKLGAILLSSSVLISCVGEPPSNFGCGSGVKVNTVDLDQARKGVRFESPRDVEDNGRIILYKHLLMINDPGIGFHVFDNRDPADPRALGFMRVPGNYDLTIKDDVLYADSYIDLIAFGLDENGKPYEMSRALSVFEGHVETVIHQQTPTLVEYEFLTWRDKKAVEESCR